MRYREENRYIQIASKILEEGYHTGNRTAIGSTVLHAEHMEFSLLEGRVPIPSTRKIPYRSAIIELLWFISGSTDVKYLKDNNVSIWDSWVIPETAVYDSAMDVGLRELERLGVLKTGLKTSHEITSFFRKYGPGTVNQLLQDLTGADVPERKLLAGSIGAGAYGAQWRKWEDVRTINYDDDSAEQKLLDLGYEDLSHVVQSDCIVAELPEIRVMRKKHDQLQAAIDTINNNPESRRIIVSAWNPGKLDLAALPPCHSFFQFLPFEKNGVKYLDLALTCRSQDFLVGTVFNVLQYSVLCHLVAKLTGRVANKLYWTGNNTHIYDNQVQLFTDVHQERLVQENPIKIEIADGITNINDFKYEHIKITGYDNFGETIKYPVAV